MALARQLEPEWLDSLPPTDPRAQASRRDLHLVNRLMGHASTRRRALTSATATSPPSRIIELGAGDGALMLALARGWPKHSPPPQAVLLDRLDSVDPAVLAGLAALGWKTEVVTADVFDWLAEMPPSATDWVLTNLFLHHFSHQQLAGLLQLLATRTALFLATEPRRSGFALAASRLLGLVGCNAVTRHDAIVSVRAGFRDAELSALWPRHDVWRLREGGAGLFSHYLLARRRQLQ